MPSRITSADGYSFAYPDAAAATFLTDLMQQRWPQHLTLLANNRFCSQTWQAPCRSAGSPTSICKYQEGGYPPNVL